MRVGLTYDLKSDYLAMGFSAEAAAEFDCDDTIDGIEAALRVLGCETDRIGHAKKLVERLAAGEKWDLVFNICEGVRGVAREAQVPAILDLYGIPYMFSDPLVLALTLHKGLTKRVIRDAGVPTSDFCVYAEPADLATIRFDAPYFVKPVAEGTGKGCTAKSLVATFEALQETCDGLVARFGQPALIEPFLPGREFTTGIIGTGRTAEAVGTMEVLLLENAEQGIYSYANKDHYEDRVVYRLCDTAVDPVAAAAERVALAAWQVLGCCDGGRVDLRCDAAACPQFLEVNPLAGLNPTHSDLPILTRLAGGDYQTLISRIFAAACQRLGLNG